VALAAAPDPPDDARTLFLKDLASWAVSILTDDRPLPDAASPARHAAVAVLLSQVADRRTGPSYRRLKQWAIRELQAARRPPASPRSEDVELEAQQRWDLLDFPGMIEVLQPFVATHPDSAGARLLLLKAFNRLGRYGDALRLGVHAVELCPSCVLELAVAHEKLGDGQDLPGEGEASGGRLAAAGRGRQQETQGEQGGEQGAEAHHWAIVHQFRNGASSAASCGLSSAILTLPQWKPPVPARCVSGVEVSFPSVCPERAGLSPVEVSREFRRSESKHGSETVRRKPSLQDDGRGSACAVQPGGRRRQRPGDA
jgi:hypothetical protein